MIDAIRRHPVAAIVFAVIVLVALRASVIVVNETNQAVIARFGKPDRILGGQQAGINWRLPFAETTVWIDKRVRDLDMDKQQVLSTDQRRLEVDAFARYRVIDPLQMYLAARSVENVETALKPILGSQLRNELGKRPFASLLSPEREGAMENIRAGLNRISRQYGVEIVDVRIKKADLPSGTPLETAYESMRTARQQEARSIIATGQKNAQIIRAEADAEAAQIYAAAFGKDPQFYDFYRAMQSYQTTFLPDSQGKDGAQTSIILSPNNEYLKEFTGR
ncbi:MAG TPA: protease modulator HflC [Sphingomicrobium sp.]|jgi:membrane protease subunit HflC|nr:protease modulator HflC [Sphingomicrobium sp.]